MRIRSLLLVLSLMSQSVTPAFAGAGAARTREEPRADARTASAPVSTSAARRNPKPEAARVTRKDGGTLAHISVGCATSPRRVPRPIVVIVPTIAIVVISVCITPQDIFRIRRN